MARIRHVEIKNFRCIRNFSWWPASGVNCLIGPGDSGKSTILDAIDLCMGARRTVQFTDADFFNLAVDAPLSITVTVGELDDALKNLDGYGSFLRGCNIKTKTIEDEPEKDAKSSLTLNLTVGGDLEPVWSLVSERAAAQGLTKNLSWADRLRLSPTRIGALADYNLAWRRGSVLNRLTDEKAETSAALAKAGRDARLAFGDMADAQLGETLKIVSDAAKELGIPVGDKLKALLDIHSVSFGGGTVSLHNTEGVPLRSLGLGSTRLLIAGLQRKAAKNSAIILIDELEHGLEPHRIIRLLGSIGAKEKTPPLQAFVTTHSPVALRELSGDQLFVVREAKGIHTADIVGASDGIQSTIRAYPDAFLAPSVIVCEGASEIGLLRGLDQHRMAHAKLPSTAYGVAMIDAVGCSSIHKRTAAFIALNYRTAALRDDDVQPEEAAENAFIKSGGALFKWRTGLSLEDELFQSLSDDGVLKLINRAVELHGEDTIASHIQSVSSGKVTLKNCRANLSKENRTLLGKASRTKQSSWFKSVTWMEDVARDIVGPDLKKADIAFWQVVDDLYKWIENGVS